MSLKRAKSTTPAQDLEVKEATSTGPELRLGASTAAETQRLPVGQLLVTRRPRLSDRIMSEAIYNHVRYLRASGMTRVDLEEVARALNLPILEVRRILPKLEKRGVKLVG